LPAATTGDHFPPAAAHATVRTGDITVSPTTSRRAQGERRSPATLWFILAAALVGVGAGLGLTLVLVRSNAPAAESTVGLAAERETPADHTSAVPQSSAEPATHPEVAVEPVSSASAAASAAPSASAPAASPSAATATRPAKPKPSAAPSTTGKPSILDSYTPTT
jgi:cytoskeletal protein RodZ